jgi:hypothetical protein
MGGRHSKQKQQAAGELSGSSSSSFMDSEGRELAPPELLAFLETASGAKWLANILLGMVLATDLAVVVVCRVPSSGAAMDCFDPGKGMAGLEGSQALFSRQNCTDKQLLLYGSWQPVKSWQQPGQPGP